MPPTTPTKSILKQSASKEPPDDEKAKAEKNQRNLSIAFNHANRIQAQKKVELHILSYIESLLDLPSTPPSLERDARTFATLIYPFQPSDFASLVEERRISGCCGYTLCPNPPRSESLGPSAIWKLKGKGAGDFCSTECVRKALYVKAQLSETPAWERVPGQQAAIVLPESDRAGDDDDRGAQTSTGTGNQAVMNGRDLAAERGEEATSFKPRQVMMDSVVEKPGKQSVNPPKLPQRLKEGSYGTIEGYESKFSKRQGDEDSDDNDDGDDDGEAANGAQDAAFSSEVISADDAFGEEEEAAWHELQAGLQHLNTAHDR